jgi:hypothetical protein
MDTDTRCIRHTMSLRRFAGCCDFSGIAGGVSMPESWWFECEENCL